ncbi:hypothetical protein KKC91_11970 [bacterium]|nr:hypothetical protein [bacterium]MBU1852679.1 hypothetical protein [Candidatus Omnitrophota bacterium]
MGTSQRWVNKKRAAKIKISTLTFVFIVFLANISLCSAQDIGWEDNFNTGVAEWYDEYDSDSFNCIITSLEDGTASIEVIGNSTWGKVAKVIEDVDLNKYPVIEIKANHVDPDSAFKVGITSLDWKEYYEIIPGQNLPGVYSESIKENVKLSNKFNSKFNLVIIIEGSNKSSIFDYIRLTSTKN